MKITSAKDRAGRAAKERFPVTMRARFAAHFDGANHAARFEKIKEIERALGS